MNATDYLRAVVQGNPMKAEDLRWRQDSVSVSIPSELYGRILGHVTRADDRTANGTHRITTPLQRANGAYVVTAWTIQAAPGMAAYKTGQFWGIIHLPTKYLLPNPMEFRSQKGAFEAMRSLAARADWSTVTADESTHPAGMCRDWLHEAKTAAKQIEGGELL